MNSRTFALVMGIVFLLVGILGFVPAFVQPHTGDAHLTVTGPGHGMLLGLFHVNLLHNVVHIVFGVMGLVMYKSAPKTYAQIVAVAYGLLVILGLIPATQTVFGLVPIEGHDVWLHAVIAITAAYFGFAAPATAGTPATAR